MKTRAFPLAIVLLAALVTVAAERAVSLGEYSADARRVIERRIVKALDESDSSGTVSGIVTFAGDDHFFLQADDDGLKVFVDDWMVPKAGDVVTVEGKPALEGGRVVFSAKKWTKTGTHDLPAARAAGSSDLTNAEAAPSKDVNWLRVSVTGRALGLTKHGFAIDVDGVPVNVIADDLPGYLKSCEKTHPRVRVEGVAELVLDQAALMGRERFVMGVKVSVGSPSDLILEPDAVYLLNCRDRRIMFLVGGLIAALVVGLLVFAVVSLRQRRRHFRDMTLMSERKRMADDLHDTIEQHLAGANMLIQLNRNREAQDILMRAKREMRDIVWGLKNDDMMRLTPAQMLRQLAHEEMKKGLYRVSTKLEGLPESLTAAAMRDLSLIVREAIANAVKHGGAKKIAISADRGEGRGWLLRIANDGKPFDPATAPGPTEGHFGVEGMRERARRIGATVSFSVKGEWTVLSLSCKR